ncbi:hypothetical protein I6E61_01015 [Psychrobacter sp. NZS113]|uniref:hypothetical protein n=1 Tax=Psychrobacter sp. NZS113 TaxID=2792045 RepID=UPI0018CCBBC8|nr:hypothetical protein [Psychrobacter sp. NZS113]MBH0094968.1 hypothetical protein [Psychrobacter sp. NZS113]
MFKFLPVKLALSASHKANNRLAYDNSLSESVQPRRSSSTLLAATLTGIILLTGCQQQSETQPVVDASQTSDPETFKDSEPMAQSEAAAARIEQFQPIYVTQMQGLQRRLQAEYESLQAADTSENADSLLGTDIKPADTDDIIDGSDKNAAGITPSITASTNSTDTATTTTAVDSDSDSTADINTSTEVGERDLTVLKRISLEPRKPTMMTEDQIIDSYQQAMDALYQPVTSPLNAEDINTLINIATLAPQLFESAEIAGRVSAKSPALARLIIQHQVWEQIEAQQVIDMQQMKIDQQKEFESLMSKFNETIEGYDEQIAKYEQTLESFK